MNCGFRFRVLGAQDLGASCCLLTVQGFRAQILT